MIKIVERFLHSVMDEEKEYKHISEKKKKSFSVKKLARIIFFIIVVVFFAVVSHKVTRLIMVNRYEKLFRDIFAKVEEDSNIQNFYEKKIWNGNLTRETYRKDRDYLIVDTASDGTATKYYYNNGVYYVLTETKDEINNASAKYATVLTNLDNPAPTIGLQSNDNKAHTDDEIKELAKMSEVKSVKIDDIECYQIYMKKLNDIFYMRKSDNRVIREIYFRKDESSGEIESIDSGVIEVNTDCVTDEDIAVPDLSNYIVEEKDVEKILKEMYNDNSDSE